MTGHKAASYGGSGFRAKFWRRESAGAIGKRATRPFQTRRIVPTFAAVKQLQSVLTIATRGGSFHDITEQVNAVVRSSGIATGLCVVFLRHTSASLVIQENADPAVLRDLDKWMGELAPEQRRWEHLDEGPDDMPSHARSAVTRSSETIPITDGKLALGTWQGLYLWEHRSRPHQRQLVVHLTGA
jgi:secondary thiamine-phosphate synthase enzyme